MQATLMTVWKTSSSALIRELTLTGPTKGIRWIANALDMVTIVWEEVCGFRLSHSSRSSDFNIFPGHLRLGLLGDWNPRCEGELPRRVEPPSKWHVRNQRNGMNLSCFWFRCGDGDL